MASRSKEDVVRKLNLQRKQAAQILGQGNQQSTVDHVQQMLAGLHKPDPLDEFDDGHSFVDTAINDGNFSPHSTASFAFQAPGYLGQTSQTAHLRSSVGAMSDAFRRSPLHQEDQHYGAYRSDQSPSDLEDSYGQQPTLAPTAQAGSAKPSLSDLERMMKEAMLQLSTSTAIPQASNLSNGDGPFDISDLWAQSSQPSISHSESMQSASHVAHSEYSEAESRDIHPSRRSSAAHVTFNLSGGEQLQGKQQHPVRGPGTRQQHTGPSQSLLQADVPQQQASAGRRKVSSAQPTGPASKARPTSASRQRQGPGLAAVHGSSNAAMAGGPLLHNQGQTQPPPPWSGGPSAARAASPGYSGRFMDGPQSSGPYLYDPPVSTEGASRAGSAARTRAPVAVPTVATRPRSTKQPTYTEPEYPFRPNINPLSREMAARVVPQNRDLHIEQLAQPKRAESARQAQLRLEKESAELAECTFQPRTGRAPTSPRARGPQDSPDLPAHERLYRVRPAWQQQRPAILQEREAAALATCTFQPLCGARASSVGRGRPHSAMASMQGLLGQQAAAAGQQAAPWPRPAAARAGPQQLPIHQRVADLLRSRNEKLTHAKLKAELAGGSMTFKPEINRRSVVLAEARLRQAPDEVGALPVAERLYRAASSPSRGNRDTAALLDQAHAKARAPLTNTKSLELLAGADLPTDFLTRQAYMSALTQEKKALYRSLLEEATCTFQPQLQQQRPGSLSSSGELMGSFGSGPAGPSTSRQDRLVKLSVADPAKSAALREALSQHYYAQYTFTPRINDNSRRIVEESGSQPSREERLQAAEERRAARASEAAAKEAAECTFQPTINARSASIGRLRRSSVLDSVEFAKQREGAGRMSSTQHARMVELRASREDAELAECTFVPAVNRSGPPPSKGPVVVPGLARYLELKDLARRKHEATTARQEEVWNIRSKSPGPVQQRVTVPQPFSFEQRVLPWQMPRAGEVQQGHGQGHGMGGGGGGGNAPRLGVAGGGVGAGRPTSAPKRGPAMTRAGSKGRRTGSPRQGKQAQGYMKGMWANQDLRARAAHIMAIMQEAGVGAHASDMHVHAHTHAHDT